MTVEYVLGGGAAEAGIPVVVGELFGGVIDADRVNAGLENDNGDSARELAAETGNEALIALFEG